MSISWKPRKKIKKIFNKFLWKSLHIPLKKQLWICFDKYEKLLIDTLEKKKTASPKILFGELFNFEIQKSVFFILENLSKRSFEWY